jgi:hypothetical protein
MRVSHYRVLRHDDAAANAALAEARSLIRPDWPAEFHIHMLRREATLARRRNAPADALSAMRAEIKLAEATGDWRLQAIARNNLVDLLWEVGSIGDAEREARRLTQDLERRPAAISDTDIAYANLLGVLCELERFDEALRCARSLLPLVRLMHNRFLEEWVYLFARVGQPAEAALLLGATEAFVAATGLPSQANEQRLLGKALSALATQLTADELARYRASGALLDADGVFELLTDALAKAESARAWRSPPE